MLYINVNKLTILYNWIFRKAEITEGLKALIQELERLSQIGIDLRIDMKYCHFSVERRDLRRRAVKNSIQMTKIIAELVEMYQSELGLVPTRYPLCAQQDLMGVMAPERLIQELAINLEFCPINRTWTPKFLGQLRRAQQHLLNHAEVLCGD